MFRFMGAMRTYNSIFWRVIGLVILGVAYARGAEPATNRGTTLPLEVSSSAAVGPRWGTRAETPAPAKTMPTAAIDAVRRRRLNEPREEGPTSDRRGDAVWRDCEWEDLATQHVVLASVRTNDPTIKERP